MDERVIIIRQINILLRLMEAKKLQKLLVLIREYTDD